jgi:phage tail sheath gpL-like
VWPVIGDEHYHHIVLPFGTATALAAAETEMDRRAGPLVAVEAIAYAGARGTTGTLAALGGARNGAFVTLIGAKSSPTHPSEWAAAYAGLIAYHAAHDPAQPFTTLELTGIVAPAIADRFMAVERDLLLRDGVSTFTVDPSGVVRLEKAITLYQLNAQGLDDVAWLDVNTPLTLFEVRRQTRYRFATKYARFKIVDDGTQLPPGGKVTTPIALKGEAVALARDLEKAGLVENVDEFKAAVVVERDAANRRRVNMQLPFDIVNGLDVIAAQINFIL